MTQRWIEAALFAVGFAMAGLVALALAWAAPGPYEDIARSNGVDGAVLLDHGTGTELRVGLPTLVEHHSLWSAYVTGGSATPPELGDLYTADEGAHMADVRRVFDGAKLMVPAGLFVMAIRLQRARQRSAEAMFAVARDGALAGGFAVALVGVLAAVAFEPAFLLFHRIFFPQGNFLFDPATSNLVRLYPDWYWQGITLRVGLSFIALAAAVAALTTWRLRVARSTRLASA